MTFLTNIEWSPSLYNKVAAIAQKAGEEMVSRLDWMTLEPTVIADVGCGTSMMSDLLQRRYPKAHLIAFDNSDAMLNFSKQHYPQLSCVCAEASYLPLMDHSVDLVFANFLLPWHPNLKSLLQECRRILRPNGLFMATALGPDTHKEWYGVLDHAFIPKLIDMHDLGDMLLQERFSDPVLDVDHYTIHYQEKKSLFKEMQASGMWLMTEEQENFLLSNTASPICEVSYELIFVHAFGPPLARKDSDEQNLVKVPLNTLRKQLTERNQGSGNRS